MTLINLRKLLSLTFAPYNAYFGDNTGEMSDYGYKINYQLPNHDLNEGQKTHRLEIDIWSKESIKVDELVDELENYLNFLSTKIENKWATFIYQNMYEANEELIFRKTLTYEVRTYEGEL